MLIVPFPCHCILLTFLERAILSLPFVLHAISEILVISHFGFDSRSLTMIVSVLDHCL